MAQFKALVVVEGSSGISVCEVGRELGIGESAASLLVDQLVRHGYVGRTTDQADRRRVLLAATAPGKKLLRELRHGRRQSLEGWLADLGDDDLDALAGGLHALTGAGERRHTPRRTRRHDGEDHGHDIAQLERRSRPSRERRVASASPTSGSCSRARRSAC